MSAGTRRFERQGLMVSTSASAGADTTIAVSGELDVATAPAVADAFRAACDDSEARTVVVDLSAVTFMDASAVRTLVRLQREAGGAGRELLLVEPGEPARRALDVLYSGRLPGELVALRAATRTPAT